MRDLCAVFEETILKIEGNTICAYEAVFQVNLLCQKIKEYIDLKYIPIEAEEELEVLSRIDDEFDKDAAIDNIVVSLYGKI